MSTVSRRLGLAMAVLGGALVAFLPTAPRAAEPAAKLPVELQFVPTDAPLFAHVQLETVWKSPLGKAARALKLPDLDPELQDLIDLYGIKPDDLRTVTVYVPELEANKHPPIVVVLTTIQEYDRKGVIDRIVRSPEVMDGKFENKDNVIRVTPNDGLPTYVDLTDPKRMVIGFGLKADPKADPARKPGVHSEVLNRHADAVFLAGVNGAKLPDEFRGEEAERELGDLGGLARADTAHLVGTVAGGKLTATATIRGNKERTAKFQKALDAFRADVVRELDRGEKWLDALQAFGDDVSEYRPLFKLLRGVLKAGTVESKDGVTTATLSVPLDLPFGPTLELFSGTRKTKLDAEQNNLKQILLALHSYHDVNNFFPPAYTVGEKDKPLLSWRVAILPFLEQEALYQKFKLDEPWDSEHNLKVVKDHPMPEAFRFFADKAEDKKTRYRVFAGNDAGLLTEGKLGFGAITDGTSNTIAVVTAEEAVPWTKPEALTFDPKKDAKPLLKFTGEITNAAMFDGSVRVVWKSVKEEALKAALTRSGGEVITLGDE